jgi:hypothetical protein
VPTGYNRARDPWDQPACTSSATVWLARATVPAPLALAFVATAVFVSAAGAATVAAGVVAVTTRGGRSSGGAAPAQAGAARASHGEEGGVGDGLLIIGQAELLENQHVVGSGERGKNSGVGYAGG